MAQASGDRVYIAGMEIVGGSGSPMDKVVSPQGSLYLRSDGASTTTRLYVNTSGSSAWTAVDAFLA